MCLPSRIGTIVTSAKIVRKHLDSLLNDIIGIILYIKHVLVENAEKVSVIFARKIEDSCRGKIKDSTEFAIIAIKSWNMGRYL